MPKDLINETTKMILNSNLSIDRLPTLIKAVIKECKALHGL